jgi:hypothetical protein
LFVLAGADKQNDINRHRGRVNAHRAYKSDYFPTTMLRHLLIVLPLALQCLASPFSGQTPLTGYASYPGFSLDLNERRLVQLEGKPPVWMTELEKVH